jgi:hypothetical protein
MSPGKNSARHAPDAAPCCLRAAHECQFNQADPAQVPALQGPLRAAVQQVHGGLHDFANQAMQLCDELLMQSRGTPKTTRVDDPPCHGSALHAVDRGPSRRRLQRTEVQGPHGRGEEGGQTSRLRSRGSLLWHRELIKTYGKDATFQQAIQQSAAIRPAWAAHTTQYGL